MKIPYLFAILSLSALLLGGCKERKNYTIGVSQCSYDDWRVKLNDELNRASLLYDDADVVIATANDDPAKQNADIRRLLDDGADILLVAPYDEETAIPAVREAKERGIPVILFDRNLNQPLADAFVGADNEQIGRTAAQYLAARVPAQARLIELTGTPRATPAIDRHHGFTEALRSDWPAIRLLASHSADWTVDDAYRVTDSLLNIYPDIDGIFAQNDRMAVGASKAVTEHARRDDIVILGVDAVPDYGLKAVADGDIDATILYPTGGDVLLRTAMQMLHGDEYPPKVNLLSALPVDRTNADMMLRIAQSLDDETDKVAFLRDRVDQYTARHHMQSLLLYMVMAVVILLAIVIFIVLRWYWQRKRHQEELDRQNRLLTEQRDAMVELNRQLNEATQAKLAFFTNVSHDLRTPLTLVAEPVAQVKDAPNLDPRQHSLLALADKNIRILMRLINQILDFRKYDNGKLTLNTEELDLRHSIMEWTDSFRPLAQKKHIHLEINVECPDGFHMAADPEKLERVLFNLMANAFKYTPANGTVTVTVRATGDSACTIEVSDTGSGIPSADIRHIFERFYQADKVRPEGSGIGLALVKSFVEMHGGSVSVADSSGSGTTFRAVIPVSHVSEAPRTAPALIDSDTVKGELAPVELPEEDFDDGKPRLLVIDDNPDIRALVRELLGDSYSIIEAPDGRQGIRLAAKYVPDIIICDVMMPGMDGMECVRILKNETTTSHIPVLMLTACSLDQQRAEGYAGGADGYMSKPFSADVLRARIDSLIQNRARLARYYTSDPAAPIANPQTSSKPTPQPAKQGLPADLDNQFFNRFSQIVNERLADPALSVEDVSGRMGLSRVQFYRKIKALTNYSPNELIRIIRLKRAYAMLTQTEDNVSEVAYAVGFSSPSYFTKCFKDYYGELPADVQRRTSRI